MTDDAKARAARVLVVEDDPVVGPLIVRMLESEGYTATLASDGDAARAAIQLATTSRSPTSFSARKTGTRSPNRSWLSSPDLRVVLMSGYGIPRYGADPNDPMLSKPFQADELVERVERALAD